MQGFCLTNTPVRQHVRWDSGGVAALVCHSVGSMTIGWHIGRGLGRGRRPWAPRHRVPLQLAHEGDQGGLILVRDAHLRLERVELRVAEDLPPRTAEDLVLW